MAATTTTTTTSVEPAAPAAASEEFGTAAAPRLMIQKMVLENFKSYAGEQEIGPFHKSFSSVVGPNGSGKSNVIDALLFVFGRRAKQIRLNKVSELIHHSDNYPDLDRATVSVYFCDIVDIDDTDDGYEVVPGSEFVVSRSAFKDNHSKYQLNGKGSNFTEVTEYLKARGIDLVHNRFLILQGEVEQIAMMKPKKDGPHGEGLLEYLEDIIGSNSYVEAIEESAARLETLSEARATQLQRVKVVERERENLEGAKAEAEACLRTEMELITAQGALYQSYAAEAEAAATAAADELSAAKAAAAEQTAAIKAKEKELAAAETEFDAANEEYKTMKTQLTDVKKQFSAFERKDIQLRENIKNFRTKTKKRKTDIKKATKTASEADSAVASAEDDKASAVAEAETVAAKLAEQEAVLEAMYDDLKGETAELQVELEAKQAELRPLAAAVAAAQQRVDVARAELAMIEEKNTAAASRLADARAAIESNAAVESDKAAEAEAMADELAAAKTELAEAEAAVEDLTSAEAEIRDQLNAARVKTEEAKSAASATADRSAVVEALLGLNDTVLKGKGIVYGRLGDLGVIDAAYDVAVSTACSTLNHIVVDSADTGAACIEHLRATRLGRANFIVLDKIGYLNGKLAAFREAAASVSGKPKGVEVLIDLIHTEPELEAAFFMGTKSAFVASSMSDKAKRFAFDNGFRMVTAKGELIESSGTMSGGGRPRSGGMRVAEGGDVAAAAAAAAAGSGPGAYTAADVERMVAEADKLSAQLKETSAKKRRYAARIAELTKKVNSLEVAISKAEMDVAAAIKARPVLEDALAALIGSDAVSDEDSDRMAELGREIAEAEAALAAALADASGVEAKVAALQDEILNVGGARVKTQKGRVDTLAAQLDNLHEGVSRAEVAAKAGVKAADKARKQVAKFEKELEELAASEEAANAELAELEEVAGKVMADFDSIKAVMEAKAEAVDEIKATYDAVKKELAAIRSSEVDVASRLEDLNAAVKDNSKKAKHWASKIAAAGAELGRLRTQFADSDAVSGESDGADAGGEAGAENAAVPEGEEEEEEEETGRRSTRSAKGKGAAGASGSGKSAIPVLDADQLANFDRKRAQAEIARLEAELAAMDPNMTAIAEYRAKEEEYLAQVAELDVATGARDAERATHEGLRKARLDAFMAGFSIIKAKVKEMYQMITLGGDAELELVDSLDPFSEGIVFSVRPLKKSWKNISNLSGGEKTLSSLALVFALHHYKPTPLYVMDEIDAALDFKNVSIVANYIKERTRNAQFVIISLRNNMFEVADRLVGIYKTNNCTKSVTINPARVAIPV